MFMLFLLLSINKSFLLTELKLTAYKINSVVLKIA